MNLKIETMSRHLETMRGWLPAARVARLLTIKVSDMDSSSEATGQVIPVHERRPERRRPFL